MKIYTNDNNSSTIKLLIASNLAGKQVDLEKTNFEALPFSGPRQLPVLQMDDQLLFFSSNAAIQYLLPVPESDRGQSQQILEWEATRLQPAIASVLTAKSVAPDLKQNLEALLLTVEKLLQNNQYVLGAKLSAADISIFSTIYPLYHKEDLNKLYLNDCKQINKWFDNIASEKSVQNAIQQCGYSSTLPLAATSVLGIPQIGNMLSPAGTPDEAAIVGPSAEEIQLAKDNWINGVENLQPIHKQEKIVLPVTDRKNVLITSALPYVNNVPHLGNIIGCVLSADIFARYCRLCDYNTLYVCGTDEYGTATETKALEEKLTPREICDKYFEIHNSVYRWFNIGFDYFGRTTTKEQTEIAQKLFLKLHDNGFITSQVENQLFCEKCDRFLADRFVEGTCPHPGCLYTEARGDQCDKCGKLVTATELVEPRCKQCASSPIVRSSENLCIMLQQLEPSIRSWIARSEHNWSAAARAATRSWLKEPLRQRAITRDLKWGVNVPVKGFENKVFYVWFDAPIGYMSITQNATNNYEAWWKPDKQHDITYYQFMAKDNVPFHVIMFPATILGVNEGHTLVKHIYATEYLNYEEGKFSKSRGVGVFGSDVRQTDIAADVWRFYLASIRPEGADSSFSWTELGTRNNSELLNNLGNFCHRSLTFCYNSFKGKVPDTNLSDADYEMIALINREVQAYVHNMEKGKLRDALRHVLSISRIGNQHMQATQPWVLLKGTDEDKVRGSTAIGVCCQLVALLCTLLSPYIPETCRKLRAQLNVDEKLLRINPTNPSFIQYIPRNHVISKPEPLFVKIEPELLETLRAKYAGTQSERAEKAGGGGVEELEKSVADQADKVRKLKATTKDKSVWQPEVDKLLLLKKQLETAKKTPTSIPQSAQSIPQFTQSIPQLEQAIAAQGDKVRQLKSASKDKALWQPEVEKLLQLKKQLAEAQKAGDSKNSAATSSGDSVANLEKQIAEQTPTSIPQSAQSIPQSTQSIPQLEQAIAAQGDKVRQLKSASKDKALWQTEVEKLLQLKKQLAEAQKAGDSKNSAATSSGDSVANLEKQIAEQGDKVRKIKASTKDKAVIQPEVNILLDLKKRLAALQTK